MVINKKVHKINVFSPTLPEGNYLKDRIGFWALVKEQNSKTNTVTVISDTGFEYPNIAVKSDEWVTVDKSKDYIPSQRNLPPVNSRVFVLTPTYSAAGAFILCSGFSRGDENIRTIWAQNNNEVEEKNNSRETKTQGGWDYTEQYKNGNINIESNDKKVKLNVQLVDVDNSNKKKIELEAWNNKITLDENGIVLKDDNNNEIKRDSNGITITDKNNNVIKMTSAGIEITDKNSNTITTTSSDIQITASSTKKIKVGNSVDTIKGLFEDLVTVLDTLQTAGSPANHTVVSGQFNTFKQKLAQVLE